MILIAIVRQLNVYKKLTKTVKLHEIFLCEYGNSLYTKAYCNQHNGNYEVFTGTTIGSFLS